MTVDTKKLKTVNNFAKMKNVTTTAVYSWISSGKEDSIKIDGVTFIIVKE